MCRVGFSLHFPRTAKTVEEDLKFHLDFFRETDTDIIKIMNENLVPDSERSVHRMTGIKFRHSV